MYVLQNNIRKYRRRCLLTQAELAEAIGVSKNAISSYENGLYYPTALHAAAICFVLCCKFEDIFYLKGEKKNG